jgi:hypothetical protein
MKISKFTEEQIASALRQAVLLAGQVRTPSITPFLNAYELVGRWSGRSGMKSKRNRL